MPPAPLACPSATQSTSFSRERDARIRWLLGMHPVTAATLVSIGWFPTRNKALKRLRRLVQRKRVRLVGTICRKAGRPEHVYCRFRPKADSLLHEVELTELCLRLDAAKILRGPEVTDARLRPDAEVWINGRLYYLELDRGTMGYAQIARRFRLYEECAHFVLWVCSSPQRVEGFRRRATAIRHTALFTTLASALTAPHGPIWQDVGGHIASLPREGDK